MAEPTVAEKLESIGEIEEEKTFYSKILGGNFTFRLPFVLDEFRVLQLRDQLLGVPEGNAGPELLALAHAQAMYRVYNVHAPHGFKLEKQRSWSPFLTLMSEVRDWQDTFLQSLGEEEESHSFSES